MNGFEPITGPVTKRQNKHGPLNKTLFSKTKNLRHKYDNKISSINSLSALCEKTEANIDEVSKAIGMDKRIGPDFLKVSPGFGGSCFKKDILNLVYLCKYYDLNEVADYWESVVKINEFQRSRIFNIVSNYIEKSNIKKEVSILGWAFKKNTNDTRESASIYVSGQFLKSNYKVQEFH